MAVDDAQRRWAAGMSEAYEDYLVPTLFTPFGVELAGRVAARQPRRVLELAAGTGAVTRQLVNVLPDAEIIATDFAPPMLEIGRERVPEVKWEQADATQLPFGDDEFDAVVCQFGVMFFPDKVEAFRQASRVLRPGGTFLFSVWSAVPQNDFAVAVEDALTELFPDAPPSFIASVPHGYNDIRAVTSDLRAGGFHSEAVETVSLDCRARSAQALARGYCFGTPIRAEIEARGGELEATTQEVARRIAERFGPSEISGRMTAEVFEAQALE